MSELKIDRKKDPLKSRTMYFEFTLQSKNGENHVVWFLPQKRGLILEVADRDNIGIDVKNAEK